MTFSATSHKFSMACGVAGAFVEITSYVFFDEGSITRSWGRQSAFSDAAPGTFAFTLNNADGRFTPGNTAILATPVSEGMRVCWELNGQLRHGTIRSLPLSFPDVGKPATLRLRVTVVDSLGYPARTSIDSLASAAVLGSAYFYWPMNDAAGSTVAREQSGNRYADLSPNLVANMPFTLGFGADSNPVSDSTQLEVSVPVVTGTNAYGMGIFEPATIYYPAGSLGSHGAWFTPTAIDSDANVDIRPNFLTRSIEFGARGGYYFVKAGDTALMQGPAIVAGRPAYVAIRVTIPTGGGSLAPTIELFVDGTSYGTTLYSQPIPGVSATTTDRGKTPEWIYLIFGSATAASTMRISSLSHTSVLVNESHALATTVANRIALIAATTPQMTMDTLPSDLSNAAIGIADSGGSALDALNEIILGEQGHLYTTTTGTLLAPVEKVTIRARQRPETVTTTFSTTADIDGAPEIQRDTTNTVSSVSVAGADIVVRVTDHDLEAVVGSANTSAQLPYSDSVDLRAFGEDRLLRGTNSGVDVTAITINARFTNTNRWADLIALTPGLRYQVTGLPLTQLGFSTRDGWLLGVDETHTPDRDDFTLYFERCQPDTGIFDADRFMAGNDLTLTSTINSAVTSMSVTTVGAKLSTTETPYNLIIDSEIVTVTACSSATPQIATITRAQGGTTAAAHTAGAQIELSPDTLFAY